ncbi:MAG: GNAT family N-acetyltransferase [Gammaproteobacteria bacterium]|nr:GNAT family N-acetyltransferase [Gammaproteobacteria bacterium]
MSELRYLKLSEVDPGELRHLLNKQRIRKHLFVHALFDDASIARWIDDKIEVDGAKGCRVRAILRDGRLVGWCGIQEASSAHEVAIVIDDGCWGLGRRIFRDLMDWAKELGHDEIDIHLYRTRPEYRFLKKISKTVFPNRMLGEQFTTYRVVVDDQRLR